MFDRHTKAAIAQAGKKQPGPGAWLLSLFNLVDVA
jgi:hypothetical protein